MDIKVKVGKRVEQLKHEAGLSNTFLGWDADLDPSYVRSIIKGERSVSATALEKICKALNVTIKQFFNDPIFE